MSERRHVPEPGELIYPPRPSWAPIFFALGALGVICGVFAAGFIFPPKIYAIVGAILILAAFRSLVRGAIRDYYRLPRRQRVRSAALPVEQITLRD
jgi:uncharacterized membrane protein YfcA